MAAKLKKSAKKPAKKVTAKFPAPKKPKPTRAAAPTPKRRAAAKVAKAPAITNNESFLNATPQWWISQLLVDNLTVFGLGNDQRVYRWNTRSASWVIHQDGAQPSN
jgi:hypothetical protein